jgi:hypothetical protein
VQSLEKRLGRYDSTDLIRDVLAAENHDEESAYKVLAMASGGSLPSSPKGEPWTFTEPLIDLPQLSLKSYYDEIFDSIADDELLEEIWKKNFNSEDDVFQEDGGVKVARFESAIIEASVANLQMIDDAYDDLDDEKAQKDGIRTHGCISAQAWHDDTDGGSSSLLEPGFPRSEDVRETLLLDDRPHHIARGRIATTSITREEQAYSIVRDAIPEDVCNSRVIQDALLNQNFDADATILYLLHTYLDLPAEQADTMNKKLLKKKYSIHQMPYASKAVSYIAAARSGSEMPGACSIPSASSSSISRQAGRLADVSAPAGDAETAAWQPVHNRNNPNNTARDVVMQPHSAQRKASSQKAPLIVVDESLGSRAAGRDQLRQQVGEWRAAATQAHADMVSKFRSATGTSRQTHGSVIAGELAKEGYEYRSRMRHAECMVAVCALRMNNPHLLLDVEDGAGKVGYLGARSEGSLVTIDLHGVTVRIAAQFIDAVTAYYSANTSAAHRRVTLRLIVGRGNHSKDGIARLGPSLQNKFKKAGLSYHTVDGEIHVRLKG